MADSMITLTLPLLEKVLQAVILSRLDILTAMVELKARLSSRARATACLNGAKLVNIMSSATANCSLEADKTSPGPRPPISKMETVVPWTAICDEHADPAKPAPTTATLAGGAAAMTVQRLREKARALNFVNCDLNSTRPSIDSFETDLSSCSCCNPVPAAREFHGERRDQS